MRKLYNHKILEQLHKSHEGQWIKIHKDYKKLTNCTSSLRQLQNAHHYWRNRGKYVQPEARVNYYDQQLIRKLIELHKLNWKLIHRDYCLITNIDVDRYRFTAAARYHLRKETNDRKIQLIDNTYNDKQIQLANDRYNDRYNNKFPEINIELLNTTNEMNIELLNTTNEMNIELLNTINNTTNNTIVLDELQPFNDEDWHF